MIFHYFPLLRLHAYTILCYHCAYRQKLDSDQEGLLVTGAGQKTEGDTSIDI